MSKVKALTPRGTHQPLAHTVIDLNRWYVGWANYYSLTQYPSQLVKIEAHIRRRLRARLVSQQKRKQPLIDIWSNGVYRESKPPRRSFPTRNDGRSPQPAR